MAVVLLSAPAFQLAQVITKYADAAGQPVVKGSGVFKTKVIASTIKEAKSEDNVVAAFAPSASLGNGTDSGSSDNVSDLGPLKCKHFIWKCTIDGPLSEFPLKVSTLVDNGCHLMLIRPDIVQKLGLPIHTLHTPEPVDVTIKNGKEKQKYILKKFVILGVTSIDQQWSSRRIQVIIAPNLCMPLILGIPFLILSWTMHYVLG
jgi:Aspartyl protease